MLKLLGQNAAVCWTNQSGLTLSALRLQGESQEEQRCFLPGLASCVADSLWLCLLHALLCLLCPALISWEFTNHTGFMLRLKVKFWQGYSCKDLLHYSHSPRFRGFRGSGHNSTHWPSWKESRRGAGFAPACNFQWLTPPLLLAILMRSVLSLNVHLFLKHLVATECWNRGVPSIWALLDMVVSRVRTDAAKASGPAYLHACHGMHGRSGKTSDAGPHLLPLFETWFLTVHQCVSCATCTMGLGVLLSLHRTLVLEMCAVVLSSTWVLGIQTQILTHAQKAVYSPNLLPSHSPASHLHFFNFEWLKVLYDILSTLRDSIKCILIILSPHSSPDPPDSPFVFFFFKRLSWRSCPDFLTFPLSPAFLEPWV